MRRAALAVVLLALALSAAPASAAKTACSPTGDVCWGAFGIGSRYMGDDRAEEFGARNAAEGELLVRLRPAHVLAEADLTA